jgi:hypothetical protein
LPDLLLIIFYLGKRLLEAEQALQASNDAKVKLSQELETTRTSLTATRDKLTIKPTILDDAVIRRDEAKIELAKSMKKLKTLWKS